MRPHPCPGVTAMTQEVSPADSAHPVVPDEDLLSPSDPQLQQAQTEGEWIHFCLTKHKIICPQQMRNRISHGSPFLSESSFTELCHSHRALDLPLPALHSDKAIPKT